MIQFGIEPFSLSGLDYNPRNVSKYTNWHWCIGERGWILITLYTKQTVTSLCMYVCLYDELNNLVEW